MMAIDIYDMRSYLSGFKVFFEDKVHSMKKHKKHEEEPENYLDRLWGELGIDPNDLPDFIESGPVELEYDGQVLLFNQCVFKLIKPIELSVPYVKIQLHNLNSPSLNRRIYVRKEDGSVKHYEGAIDEKEIIISIDKLAEMLGRGWQAAANQSQGGMGGGMGGGIGGM